MTLVLSVLTPSHVVQVSDRRLVWLRNGSIERHDDEKNKAVLWAGRIQFAYTGLAELGRERRTDKWLAEALSKSYTRAVADPNIDAVDQTYFLESLVREATDYFRGPRISKIDSSLRRHAFVAVGWGIVDDELDFSPYIVLISNFHDPNWVEMDQARDEFWYGMRRLGGEDSVHVFSIGYPLSAGEVSSLTKKVRQIVDDPTAIVVALAEKIREVASQSATVGRGLMANVLPREFVAANLEEQFVDLGPPKEGQATYLYIPPDDAPVVHWGPTVVSANGMILSDIMWSDPSVADPKPLIKNLRRPTR